MVSKGNVLLVDDEINLCRIIGAKLARSGYSVTAVHDGLQAVEKVRESDYDVVLLDLILPKMDGLAALAEIRSLRSGLPVIVMTACENAEAVEQARSFGVSAYVNKPFDLDNLVSLVSNTSQCKTGLCERKLPESTVLFSKDQPITLEIQNGYSGKAYASRIWDKDDRTLTVLAPYCDDVLVEVPPRASVKIGLAAKDAFFSFTTHVLRSSESPEQVLVLDKPSVIYRAQRREHSRIPLRLPMGYALREDEADETTGFADAETRDLSLGGACILVPEDIEPGTVLRIELRPKTSKDTVSALARVLRSRRSDQPDDDGWYVGCQFILADPSLHRLLQQ